MRGSLLLHCSSTFATRSHLVIVTSHDCVLSGRHLTPFVHSLLVVTKRREHSNARTDSTKKDSVESYVDGVDRLPHSVEEKRNGRHIASAWFLKQREDAEIQNERREILTFSDQSHTLKHALNTITKSSSLFGIGRRVPTKANTVCCSSQTNESEGRHKGVTVPRE